MPVYEYVCKSCGHEFEEFTRSMTDSDVVTCPACGKRTAERKLSVFAARQGASKPVGVSAGGPCNRCGDPNGPCSV